MAAAAQTKYGIKIASSEYESGRKKIEGICVFKSGNLLSGFTEITEKNYLDWTEGLTEFHYWDVAESTVAKDTEAEEETSEANLKTAQRERLKWLYFEIIFTDELGESTTVLQNEYDALLLEYNAPIEE